MVLSDTISFVLVLSLTIVFTAFAFTIQDKMWNVLLKFIAGMWWMILGVSLFYFMGSGGFLVILSLPFAIIGMIFWFMLIHDFLDEKRKRPFEFDE